MTPGDMLFMYSDGVTEERNSDRELFSEKRLVSVLASTTVDSVENAVRDTVAAVEDFRGDGDQEDDITVLAVQFQGSSVCIAPGSLDTSLSHAAGLSDIAVCHA